MNSALYVLFAKIPPTFAAAKKTYSGFSLEKKFSTCSCCLKSYSG